MEIVAYGACCFILGLAFGSSLPKKNWFFGVLIWTYRIATAISFCAVFTLGLLQQQVLATFVMLSGFIFGQILVVPLFRLILDLWSDRRKAES